MSETPEDLSAGPHCENCETLLQGDFCHRCGQENRNYVRSALGLITEFLGELSNWDNRLWRTLWPLWTRPGQLSLRYVSGHRAPYVPPLRLYIFTSIVAFLVFAQLVPTEAINFEKPPNFMENREQTDAPQDPLPNAPPATEPGAEPGGIAEDFRVSLPFINSATERQLEENFVRLIDNPKLGINNFFSLAPQMMFLLLPVFALLLKLLYIGRKHYYLEHLILALHTHSFILQLMLAYIGLSLAASALAWLPFIPTVIDYLGLLLLWYLPLYLLLSQKGFYRQSWPVTLVKFSLTGVVYCTLLLAAMLVAMLLSVLWS